MNVVTLSECVTRFSEAGIAAGDTIVVHGSLKAVGWISGGANTIIDALLQVIGPQGTLIVPAQYTENLDPGLLDQPIDPSLAKVLRQSQPPFRGKATHFPSMGALTTAVQLDERSKISDHPTCAVVALGKHAKWITADHPLSPAFGWGSPYAKAAELNAKVVLIGVDYSVLSALHTVQVQTKALPWCIHAACVGPLEAPHRVTYLDLNYTTASFNVIGLAYESAHPISPLRLGHAVLKVLELTELLKFAKTWMERNETL
jgi:aminoglycoside 3-N-acetyltransferase